MTRNALLFVALWAFLYQLKWFPIFWSSFTGGDGASLTKDYILAQDAAQTTTHAASQSEFHNHTHFAEDYISSSVIVQDGKHNTPPAISSYPGSDINSLYNPANLDVKSLQPWLQDYLKWHAEMRDKFPGSQLLEHPDAPKLLIKVCIPNWFLRGNVPTNCNGLHDRMKIIPVYMAWKTNRVLLYKWMHPYPLEEFLEPNVVDWTVPDSDVVPINNTGFLRKGLITDALRVKKNQYGNSLRLLREDPNWFKRKIVTIVKERDSLKYMDEKRISKNIPEPDTEFGTLWHLFFKPSTGVEKELTEAMQQGNLAAKQYVATHCRVQHPGRTQFLGESHSDIMTMTKEGGDADHSGTGRSG